MRLGRLWNVYRPLQGVQLETAVGRPAWVSRLGLWYFYVLVPVAVAGAVVLRRRRTLVFPFLSMIILSSVTAILAYGDARFALEADVAMAMLAGVALDAAIHAARSWSSMQAESPVSHGDRDDDDVTTRDDRASRPTARRTRAGVRAARDRAGPRGRGAAPAPAVSRVRRSPGHRGHHRRRGARQLRRRPDRGAQQRRDLHRPIRDRRLGVLSHLGLPALPAVRRGAPRRGPQAADGRVLDPAALAHRAGVLAGAVRRNVDTPRRPGYRSRWLAGVCLPLSLPSDLLAVSDAEGDLRRVVALRRDDLLPVHPAVCRPDRLASVVAHGRATGAHRADRSGGHDRDQLHVALYRAAVPARPLVLLASGHHLASGLLGSLRPRHGSGGGQRLDAPRGSRLPLDVRYASSPGSRGPAPAPASGRCPTSGYRSSPSTRSRPSTWPDRPSTGRSPSSCSSRRSSARKERG